MSADMADLLRAAMTLGVTPDERYTWTWTFPSRERAEREYAAARRYIAHLYRVPVYIAGFAKRPPQPKVAGQRGTGHHRRHRR